MAVRRGYEEGPHAQEAIAVIDRLRDNHGTDEQVSVAATGHTHLQRAKLPGRHDRRRAVEKHRRLPPALPLVGCEADVVTVGLGAIDDNDMGHLLKRGDLEEHDEIRRAIICLAAKAISAYSDAIVRGIQIRGGGAAGDKRQQQAQE
jgi:hypothetical protein